MTDLDVLACILFVGSRRPNTTRLAYELLEIYGSFANVVSLPAADLLAIKGLTTSCVLALKSVRLSSLFLLRKDITRRLVLSSRARLEEYLQALLGREQLEQSRVIFLDAKHRLLGEKLLSKGTVNHVSVYPRDVLKDALALNATALVLIHNHPSGTSIPSDEDIEMTIQFQKLCNELGITLHDHIIVTSESCFSLIKDGASLFPRQETAVEKSVKKILNEGSITANKLRSKS
jgi:DNA repair protein RadC